MIDTLFAALQRVREHHVFRNPSGALERQADGALRSRRRPKPRLEEHLSNPPARAGGDSGPMTVPDGTTESSILALDDGDVYVCQGRHPRAPALVLPDRSLRVLHPPAPGRRDQCQEKIHGLRLGRLAADGLPARTDADVHAERWKVHPAAEEIVSCLIGRIRLCLRPEPAGRQEEEVRPVAGTAAVVPRGLWHHIELDVPGNIMAVTLPRGGRLEMRTGTWKPRPARSRPAPSSTAALSSTSGSATGRVVTRSTKTGER
ncbi:hypothetical protein ACFQ08_08245 [Streptosporangium algeriense]|uniref:Uncharacterized protein n=1 Tax=Streptosporangium algeriense TaxID=1682748 RepID=A0ABW3DPH1_9ACTN